MISGVSFRGNSLDSAKDLLNQPQRHAKAQDQAAVQTPVVAPKKKGKAGKIIAGTLATVAVAAAALAAGNKFGGFQKVIDWAGKDGANTVTKWIGKGAEYMNKAGGAIVEGVAGALAKIGIGGKK